MPAPTFSAKDFVTRALRLLGAIDPTEPLEADEATDGLAILNDMVEDWQNQRATVHIIEPKQYPLTINVGSYTIGEGGTFNQVRPVWIDRWSAIPNRGASPVLEIPHRRALTLPEWQRIPQKSATASFPYALYYDHGFAVGLGKVYVYPVPNVSIADVIIYTPGVLTRFADLDTAYSFPQGYPRAIRYNLALELAPEWSATPSEVVVGLARESKASIKRANHRPVEADFDAALVGRVGRYNAYTDGYR